MLFHEFIVNGITYKLRLTTRNVIALERKYGCSPLALFEDEQVPKLDVLADIIHAAVQTYHHGLNLNDVYDIIDKWLEEGNNTTDLIYVVLELFKVSGIIPKDINVKQTQEGNETEKN